MEGAQMLQGSVDIISSKEVHQTLITDGSVGVKGMRVMLVAWYHLVTTALLAINFILLSALPEPPLMAPRRGVTRRWRRERFRERCQTRHSRVANINYL